MANTPEGAVKKAIRNLLDSVGAYYCMYVPVGYGSGKGTPDFLICHQGRFIAVEAKAGRGKTTALQDMTLQKIRDTGGVAMVINEHNLDDLRKILYEVEIG